MCGVGQEASNYFMVLAQREPARWYLKAVEALDVDRPGRSVLVNRAAWRTTRRETTNDDPTRKAEKRERGDVRRTD